MQATVETLSNLERRMTIAVPLKPLEEEINQRLVRIMQEAFRAIWQVAQDNKVTLRTAPPGTGIIAGGPMRAVFESVGMQDVVAKSKGSSNTYNMVRATFDALKNSTTPAEVAAKRGKSVEEIFAA